MTRLIHLNGPPGIGKSTLARLYVDDRPGVLNLDIDQVRALIGGWRERFEETGEIVRLLARSMAGTHLRSGHDVIMSQYLGRSSEIERFEEVARDARAEFWEIVLMDTKENSLDRFDRRGENDELPWHRLVQELVERSGGRAHLATMHDRLTDVLRTRPEATVIASTAGAVRTTYETMTTVLDNRY